MSFDVNRKESVGQAPDQASQTIAAVIKDLGGSLSDKSNPAKGQLEAVFNKKVGSQPLKNRCQLRVKVVAAGSGSGVMAKAYPVDPMGNKLTFGVRGDAAQTVMDTFFSELETQTGE